MATVVNDRDVLIMGTSPRFTPPTDRGMFITPSSAVFKVSADGSTASPASFTFQVTLLNMTGTVTFSFSSGMTPTVSGNTVTLSYANMSAVSGTITATITVDGQLFTAIANVTKVADGATGQNGIRGNVDIAAVTTGSVWSDSQAVAALAAAGYGAPQVRDLVKLYKSDRTFSVQKMYNGSAWVAVDYVYDGSVFVKGSILPESIDTRGLTIKDVQGNIILGSGTGLPMAYAAPGTLNSDLTPAISAAATTAAWGSVSGRPADDQIRNNLIDLSWWQRSATIPWGQNADTNFMCSSLNDAGVIGPKGGEDVVWYAKESGNNGEQGGGWLDVPITLDPTKTYRFVLPIRRKSGGGGSFWGTRGVCDLNTASINTNPYFATMNTADGVLLSDRWYLFVGYVYPAGSTGNTSTSAGVWDCKTGQKVWGGSNFTFAAGSGTIYHRAYQFYATNLAEQLFGRPMVNLVDGTEPSLREYFEAGAVLNTAITLGANGTLSGAGGGQVTLPGLGQNTYRVVTCGSSVTVALPAAQGFYKNGAVQSVGLGRSYNVIVITRSTGAVAAATNYDVYGSTAAAAAMTNYLNNVDSSHVVVVISYDEPLTNRLSSGLDAAMYRCGASRAIYGSPSFQYRSAYVLIGIPGCGEGNGAEAYQGAVSADPNAWVDVSFSLLNGSLIGVTANYTPRSLVDYGYTGDMNATSDLVLIGRGTTITGNTITKTQNTANWDADAYSKDSFTGGAYASAVAAETNLAVMFGLNGAPWDDLGYGGIDYAVYFNTSGGVEVYESGNGLGVFTTRAVGDVFAVVYDGSSVKYLKNGTVFYTSVHAAASTPNQVLYFDSSFFFYGTTLKNVRFGPMSSNNWNNVGGNGKPADYATVSGADAATALGFNPQFSNWTGTYPAGWQAWTGPAPVKETSTVRTAPYAVKYTVASDTGMVAGTGFQTPLPVGTFVQGAYDINIIGNAGGGGAPGYLIRLFTNAAQTVYTDTAVPVPDKTVTGWQRVPFTARVPSGQQIWAITIYQMAAYSGMPGGRWADGSVCVFDNLAFDFRDSSIDNNVLVPSITSASQTAVWTSVSGSGKPADNATVGATIGTNLFGQMNASNISTYIASAAIQSALIADLRTANYSEDGSGNPTAGAKLASAGTALKVANNSFQIGTATFSDYWFRLVQGIDGSITNGKVIWRGNNDATTRGGAPNIGCLSITPIGSQVLNSNFQQIYHSFTLTPTSYSAYTDNLDAMQQIHVQLFAATSSSTPFVEFYWPCPSRNYDGASGIARGSWSWGWRFSGNGALPGVSQQYETNGVFTGLMRVRMANTYGWSATQDFAAGSANGTALGYTTITGTSGSSGGGSGTAGGACPAPWVKVRLANGTDVNAGDLHDGARVMAVDDNTMLPLPQGGVLRDVRIIWAQRYRVKLVDGRITEWSENHRFAVVGRGWVHVQNLRGGDQIMGLDECVVESVLAVGEGQVVSYRVEGAGTYFAGGMLCHNFKMLP